MWPQNARQGFVSHSSTHKGLSSRQRDPGQISAILGLKCNKYYNTAILAYINTALVIQHYVRYSDHFKLCTTTGRWFVQPIFSILYLERTQNSCRFEVNIS